MARSIPSHRFPDLIAAATRIFIESGYRRTQMADIAAELGVAKGTLYGYVEGKAALFHLVLQSADRAVPTEVPAALPLPNPATGATLALVAQALANGNAMPLLAQAVLLEKADDIAAEFEALTRELFEIHASHRSGIKLLDRCASEVPELAELWREAGRGAELDLLGRYLERRMAAGQIAALATPSLGARIWLETVVTWAVHIHWDRNPQKIDESAAKEAVVAILCSGFLAKAPAR